MKEKKPEEKLALKLQAIRNRKLKILVKDLLSFARITKAISNARSEEWLRSSSNSHDSELLLEEEGGDLCLLMCRDIAVLYGMMSKYKSSKSNKAATEILQATATGICKPDLKEKFLNSSELESESSNCEDLPGLHFCCDYDCKNGTIYAFAWTALLNRTAWQLASTADSSDTELKAARRSMQEKIGNTLFLHRQVKLFEFGASAVTLETLLYAVRAFCLLLSPLAIGRAEQLGQADSPDYPYAIEQLNQLFSGSLRALTSCPTDPQKIYHAQEFSHWLANTRIGGRGGYLLATEPVLENCLASVKHSCSAAELLTVYDSESGSNWAGLLAEVVSRLDLFARSISGDS